MTISFIDCFPIQLGIFFLTRLADSKEVSEPEGHGHTSKMGMPLLQFLCRQEGHVGDDVECDEATHDSESDGDGSSSRHVFLRVFPFCGTLTYSRDRLSMHRR